MSLIPKKGFHACETSAVRFKTVSEMIIIPYKWHYIWHSPWLYNNEENLVLIKIPSCPLAVELQGYLLFYLEILQR